MSNEANTPPNRVSKIIITPDHEIGDVMLKIQGLSEDGTIEGILFSARCKSLPDAVETLSNWMKGVIIV